MIQQNEATGINTSSKGPHPDGNDITGISKTSCCCLRVVATDESLKPVFTDGYWHCCMS